jgi:hypothetical protein
MREQVGDGPSRLPSRLNLTLQGLGKRKRRRRRRRRKTTRETKCAKPVGRQFRRASPV